MLGRDRWKIWAEKVKYLIFPGLSKGIIPNGPQMVGRPLITYFSTINFPRL